MDFPTLRALALVRLVELGHTSPEVAMLRYSENRAELTSDLRERVFHNDAATAAFLQSLSETTTNNNKHANTP